MKALAPLGVLVSASSFAHQAPKRTTRLEVALAGPQVAGGSFTAQPRTMFRAGSRYGRIDLWNKTARHGVDPDPSFNCKMPIFADDSKEVSALEFGLEMDFFRSKAAARQQGAVLPGKQTTQYQVKIGGSKLALFTCPRLEHPLAVGRVRAKGGEILCDSGYGEVPFDARLFAMSEGVRCKKSSNRVQP